ncbi:DUF1569 domain-containing protein [Flavobacterium sp. MDT1-60]|uniref:DUF1569 domain-containing protein n=1 Tax=Flavobacterium sp. MDT1-60 TaxID=1979344 RepID=UPI001785DBFA|nr:DUF1569 domain-containing protein [Flavobacterium sp. MDT1-60]QOG00829.1 DUF1569 domain-containing protein [Flavobacterium sp. MDT1-60]
MKNIFHTDDSQEFVNRINQLTPQSKALWGKMTVAQMLAHCNIAYEMVYEDIHPKPNAFIRLILKLLVKNSVVSEKPYPKNNHTAPQFIIKDERNFDIERDRLIAYLNKTNELGVSNFEGKESLSFGKLSAVEWNNMFAKHLQHHLSQFGV